MTGNDVYKKMQDSVEMIDISFDNGNTSQKYKKIPLSEIPFIGAGVAGIVNVLKEKNAGATQENTQELYVAINPHGRGHMADAKDGLGKIGAVVDEHGIVGQMRFVPYNVTNDNSNANAAALVCAVAAVGVACYVIEQRVNNVYDRLDSIERHLEIKSESALIARYKVLYKIFKEYPYYAENEVAKSAKLNQINRAGECAGDIFEEYKGHFEELCKKSPSEKRINKMIYYIYYLLSAIKGYSLASYLELLYDGNNFQEGLILSKKEDVENMLTDYSKVCNSFWEYVKKHGEKRGEKADFIYNVGMNSIASFGSMLTKNHSSVNVTPYYSSNLISDGFKTLFQAAEMNKYQPIFEEMLGAETLSEVGLDRFDYLNELANEDNSFVIDGTYLYLLAS